MKNDVKRFRWRGLRGEWSRDWGLALELINWGEDRDWSLCVAPVYGRLYLSLPFMRRRRSSDTMMDSWGFSWRWGPHDNASVHLRWGGRTKIVHLPWEWTWFRTSHLRADGTWHHQRRAAALGSGWLRWADNPDAWKATLPYRYVLRSGSVQEREATITAQEMEWRWAAARLLRSPWPRKVKRMIDVEFSDEVGERSGSWKGGCIGCSYEMRPGEAAEDCLRRMERERVFR